MNTSELRAKSSAELKEEMLTLRREQLNLRLQKGMGEEPRPHHFKKVQREIARVKTIMNEKERQS